MTFGLLDCMTGVADFMDAAVNDGERVTHGDYLIVSLCKR